MSKKKKSYIIFVSVIVIGLVLDLVSKPIFANYFQSGAKDIVVIPNFFSFTFLKNTGAAFGIFGNSTLALTLVSLIFVGLFICYDIFYHSNNICYILGLSMLISGAIGNLVDRIFLGYVRDFINIEIFPFVFNIADALITFGVIFFAVYLLFYCFNKESALSDKKTAKGTMSIAGSSSENVTSAENKSAEDIIEENKEKEPSTKDVEKN